MQRGGSWSELDALSNLLCLVCTAKVSGFRVHHIGRGEDHHHMHPLHTIRPIARLCAQQSLLWLALLAPPGPGRFMVPTQQGPPILGQSG